MNSHINKPSNTGKNENTKLRINYLCVLYLLLSSISPPLHVGTSRYIGICVSFAIWLFTSYSLRPQFYLKINRVVGLVIFNIVYTIFVMFATDNAVYIKLQLGLFLFYSYAVIYIFYRKYFPERLKNLFWTIAAVTPVWCLITIRALITMPFIARQSGDEFVPYLKQGIGGYFLVYASIVIGVSALHAALYAKTLSKQQKAYLFILSAICGVLVIKGGFSLGLFTLVLSLAIILFANRRGYFRFSGLGMATLILLITLLFSYTGHIADSISSLAEGTPYAVKVNDIGGVLSGETEHASTVDSREGTYLLSWNTFLEHPLLGSMFGGKVAFGWHSTILDSFAQFGFLIGISNLCILLFVPYRLFLAKDYKHTSLALSIMAVSIVILLFNNITDAFGVGIFFVFPYAVGLINIKENCGNVKAA